MKFSIRATPVLAAICLSGLCAAAGTASFEESLAKLQKASAADPTNSQILFQLGDLCHDEGARGSKKAVQLAEKYFTDYLRLHPEAPRALALLGSTLTMKARDTGWPGKQIGYVKEGNRKMDRAVSLAPDDPDVRFTRAANNFHMPKFLGREALVREDFLWLWERVKARPAEFSNAFKQEVALRQGMILRKQEKTAEAEAVWLKGLEFDPKSEFAGEIRAELARLGRPR